MTRERGGAAGWSSAPGAESSGCRRASHARAAWRRSNVSDWRKTILPRRLMRICARKAVVPSLRFRVIIVPMAVQHSLFGTTMLYLAFENERKQAEMGTQWPAFE